MEKTYKLKRDQVGNPLGIKCLVCGMTSNSASDMKEKYCGNCHKFHSQMMQEKELEKNDDES